MTDPITRADRIRDRELDHDIDAEQDRRDAPDEPEGEVHDRLRAMLRASPRGLSETMLINEAADLLEHYFAADYEGQLRDCRFALSTAQKARAAAERGFSSVVDAAPEIADLCIELAEKLARIEEIAGGAS